MKLPAPVKQALASSGLRWQVISGKKHIKLFIEGRLAAVLSHGTNRGGPQGYANVLAEIRRAEKRASPAQPVRVGEAGRVVE